MKTRVILFLSVLLTLHLAGPAARAGYTHYFTWRQKPDEASLKTCLADMGLVLRASTELVAGADGEGAPEIEPLQIEFNGKGDDAHEPFVFPGQAGFNFCKTQYKPYDAVVTACLLVARDHFPHEVLEIASDGNWEEGDWDEGAKLYRKIFGRAPAFPLRDDDDSLPALDNPVFVRVIGSALFAALVLGALWLALRSQALFKIRIQNGKARTVRGVVTHSFEEEINRISRDYGISKGWITGHRARRRVVLAFSRNIPDACRQRIRNVWAML